MKTIKTLTLFTLVALVVTGFISCESDDDNTTITEPILSERVENLAAPQTGGQGEPVGGAFTKFDFATGMETTSDTEWDIAFRGTTIAINGGATTGTADEPERNGNAAAAIITGTFASVTTAQEIAFTQDAETSFAIPTGSDNGWYNYDFTNNIVAPIPGRVLVFRTRNGHYAKVEIISYYLDQDNSNPAAGRNFTFDYVYNPNEGDTFFE